RIDIIHNDQLDKEKEFNAEDCYDVDVSTEAVEDKLLEVEGDEELNENLELQEDIAVGDKTTDPLSESNEGDTVEDEESSPFIEINGDTEEDEESSPLINDKDFFLMVQLQKMPLIMRLIKNYMEWLRTCLKKHVTYS
uniref:Uncharacterized protein n=1 Tax=Amphimedon queenslandica TaxID=400682 RepID=A0A1X7TM67_AMPQE